jgi:hypothetical protein
MMRSNCFGRCPVYDLLIDHGQIQYLGKRNVGRIGKETSTLSSDQIAQLLQEVDRIHFFELEDRAFEHCADAPEVTIAISMGSRHRIVSSSTFCTGAVAGPQANFVDLTRKIDQIVGSDRWTRCTGPCSI